MKSGIDWNVKSREWHLGDLSCVGGYRFAHVIQTHMYMCTSNSCMLFMSILYTQVHQVYWATQVHHWSLSGTSHLNSGGQRARSSMPPTRIATRSLFLTILFHVASKSVSLKLIVVVLSCRSSSGFKLVCCSNCLNFIRFNLKTLNFWRSQYGEWKCMYMHAQSINW